MEQSNVFDSTPLMVPYLDAHLVIFLLDFLRDVSDVFDQSKCFVYAKLYSCVVLCFVSMHIVWCVQPTGHLSCKDSCGGKNQHDHGRGR